MVLAQHGQFGPFDSNAVFWDARGELSLYEEGALPWYLGGVQRVGAELWTGVGERVQIIEATTTGEPSLPPPTPPPEARIESVPKDDGEDPKVLPPGWAGRQRRTDTSGAARRGSQLQTQLWVNQRPAALGEHIRAALPKLRDADIEWSSPLASRKYAEYRDGRFLQAIGYPELAEPLRAFWPARGPVWDALATAHFTDGGTGVLLVEGKSYVGELRSGGCKAKGSSLEKIEKAFAATHAGLGIRPKPGSWLGPLYQSANRVAHAHWLRTTCGVRAYLVHLLFTDDPTWPVDQRASHADWSAAMRAADETLGLDQVNLPWACHIVLPGQRPQDWPPPAPAIAR